MKRVFIGINIQKSILIIAMLFFTVFQSNGQDSKPDASGYVRWPNFHGQKNLLNLEINYGSEKAKREPTQV
jgi:hypothetical protein